MGKTMVIGGETFEVIRSRRTDDYVVWHTYDYFNRKTLYDFYKKPSQAKQDIWEYWLDWQRMNDCVDSMRVKSASCFTFTISAYYVDPDTYEIIGYFKITKSHNRLYLYK